MFGSGKYLPATVNRGSVNQVYSLSYLNPYYTVDGVSQGFDVYKRKTDASSLAIGAYVTDAIGGGVKFGYPVSETAAVDFGLNLESTAPGDLRQPARCSTSASSTTSATTTPTRASAPASSRDTRDSVLQTRRARCSAWAANSPAAT